MPSRRRRSLTFAFPLGACLETAALICLGDHEAARTLLRAAAVIRERGQRPGPATLRQEVSRARGALDAGAGPYLGTQPDIAAAVDLAIAVLESRPGVVCEVRTR